MYFSTKDPGQQAFTFQVGVGKVIAGIYKLIYLFYLKTLYQLYLRPKKKLFVSCNPTLTSFYSKKSLP